MRTIRSLLEGAEAEALRAIGIDVSGVLKPPFPHAPRARGFPARLGLPEEVRARGTRNGKPALLDGKPALHLTHG
ncbi:hypothetical protein FRACA_200020 [Frankia canadensis]|uniref:Uncharacterized protein n=1 Tax=Frankia canadensis TaxID=1836972 RepID=A0A2I2KQ43_9ACTN|nr:hypothetical protein FRACA_200020 [Frankia canadensis]SOU55072.1 hypothetical protein FRACA_200020 [Frankia canadensis]